MYIRFEPHHERECVLLELGVADRSKKSCLPNPVREAQISASLVRSFLYHSFTTIYINSFSALINYTQSL